MGFGIQSDRDLFPGDISNVIHSWMSWTPILSKWSLEYLFHTLSQGNIFFSRICTQGDSHDYNALWMLNNIELIKFNIFNNWHALAWVFKGAYMGSYTAISLTKLANIGYLKNTNVVFLAEQVSYISSEWTILFLRNQWNNVWYDQNTCQYTDILTGFLFFC